LVSGRLINVQEIGSILLGFTLLSIKAVVVEGDIWGVTMAHMLLHCPNNLAEILEASYTSSNKMVRSRLTILPYRESIHRVWKRESK
jgi:hypothetical protein